ncbi:imidazole glycerol phosphate synthase subunit HisH [Sphingomonas changnyeongensis]|uniref:Imidazole glycerol phosphate synthase subunit HisH n=1 Tax=Sphingomonas changnyeongensis TaxID=2698679 RepID=A0A7Z2S7Y0_9SPHN|nr:imidazole glycerol phosphate synthase subunit HisH [Sphingomonas changnyeongensis]QHL90102.1 imidazole glycerol phosphate synthase subunit HisH [Sphingomonas changnyeongensis]
MAETVALVDYGAGNVHSVLNALRAAGAGTVELTADPDRLRRADRIVLPGVGAFAAAMRALAAAPGLIDALDARVRGQGIPFLGICVGMQLMATTGEEHGRTAGLGWLDGVVRAVPAQGVKVPHMGWNDVTPTAAHPLLPAGEAYFLHSFAYHGEDVLAVTDHGGPVTAAIGRDNMVGVQFHPEKSQRYGLALLQSFLAWRP